MLGQFACYASMIHPGGSDWQNFKNGAGDKRWAKDGNVCVRPKESKHENRCDDMGRHCRSELKVKLSDRYLREGQLKRRQRKRKGNNYQ